MLDGAYEFIEAKILEKSELLNKKIRDSIYEDIRITIVRKDKVVIPRSILFLKRYCFFLRTIKEVESILV